MKSFYNFEIENGYIDQECDYEGYLGWRNVSLPVADIALIVNEDNLYAYKIFELDTIFEDSEIFKEEENKRQYFESIAKLDLEDFLDLA